MTTLTAISTHVSTMCDRTHDAYSYTAYGEQGWRSAIRMLMRHGLTDREIEAVLRSKWTRWAGDVASNTGKRYGQFNGADLERFMNTAKGCGWANVAALTAETEQMVGK